MKNGWPEKGDKVKFLGKNGYDRQREDALKVMQVDQILTVKEVRIDSWSSCYWFDEVPGAFNTVMFKYVRPQEHVDFQEKFIQENYAKSYVPNETPIEYELAFRRGVEAGIKFAKLYPEKL